MVRKGILSFRSKTTENPIEFRYPLPHNDAPFETLSQVLRELAVSRQIPACPGHI